MNELLGMYGFMKLNERINRNDLIHEIEWINYWECMDSWKRINEFSRINAWIGKRIFYLITLKHASSRDFTDAG